MNANSEQNVAVPTPPTGNLRSQISNSLRDELAEACLAENEAYRLRGIAETAYANADEAWQKAYQHRRAISKKLEAGRIGPSGRITNEKGA